MFLLVFYFVHSGVCVSVPVFQFIPPLPLYSGKHKLVFQICNPISVLWISSFVPLFQIPHITIYDVCLSLTHFTQYDNTQAIHAAAAGIISSLFIVKQYSLRVYTPHLHPFFYWWPFRLPPCLSYCEEGWYKHWGTYIFLNQSFLQEWNCWIIWQLYFFFFEESPYCSPQQLYQFTSPQTVQECPLSSIPSLVFIVCRLFNDDLSDWCEAIPIVV